MNENIAHLEKCLNRYETTVEKIEFLELKERQQYHYYASCTCGDSWTDEQEREYQAIWNWIIERLSELKKH